MLIVNAEMGKENQEMRARKSRRKVSCLTCDKTMSWEYFRNRHVPTVHNGKKYPLKLFLEQKPLQDPLHKVLILETFLRRL